MIFQKGDKVRLNQDALNHIYPDERTWYRAWAKGKIFIVIGHSRDKSCTRVITVGGNPNTQTTYHNSFLEVVCLKV